jgi:hypothetical protein
MGVDYWGPRIALILCGLFLAVLIAGLTYAWIKGYKAEFWNRIEGKVAGSKIEKVEDSDGCYYQARIEYSYEISGSSYKGNNWYRSGPKVFQSKNYAEAFLRGFPENKSVTVYVNPEKESESCLRTMEDAKLLLGIFVAFLMLLFCIAKWNSL